MWFRRLAPSHKLPGPVAVGGVGGSGTRVVADLVVAAGLYIGSDLNQMRDNLWFTLLFVRPQILVASRTSFERLAALFFRRMGASRDESPSELDVALVTGLSARPRAQYEPDWLAERARSFLAADAPARSSRWGWKAPNTHVVAERFLEYDPNLIYIHVMRNGLDMAFSPNQNQLQMWGTVFLGRQVEVGPRDALAYWCAVHDRMRELTERFPDRVLLLDFDAFCVSPRDGAERVLAFIGGATDEFDLEAFLGRVRVPASCGRFRAHDATTLDPADIAAVARWGYDTP